MTQVVIDIPASLAPAMPSTQTIDAAINLIAWSPVAFVAGLVLVALFQALFREAQPHQPSQAHDRKEYLARFRKQNPPRPAWLYKRVHLWPRSRLTAGPSGTELR